MKQIKVYNKQIDSQPQIDIDRFAKKKNTTKIKMFKKILIANRGEIAVRVAKSAHRLGIKTVGVYSEADKFAQHPKVMDQAFMVGPAAAAESYLKVPHLLEVAKYTKAKAIHPG